MKEIKKIKTDAKEIAKHFNGYFTCIEGKLNRKIAKAKNFHLSYLGPMKENNMFPTPTTPDHVEDLIRNMEENKVVGQKSIPTKILKDYKSKFSKPLSNMINTSFTTAIFPNTFKVANAISVHKKSDKFNHNNY